MYRYLCIFDSPVISNSVKRKSSYKNDMKLFMYHVRGKSNGQGELKSFIRVGNGLKRSDDEFIKLLLQFVKVRMREKNEIEYSCVAGKYGACRIKMFIK